jgi:SNF2-related domain/Helicase conserved C-terminal domain
VAEVSPQSVLGTLTKGRLGELLRDTDTPSIRPNSTKEEHVAAFIGTGTDLPTVLARLRRDELRIACKMHGLDHTGRGRSDLAVRLLEGAGVSRAADPAAQYSKRRRAPGDLPKKGDIVRVRHRQYLVEEVKEPLEPMHQTLVSLVCLDDDAPGRRLEVLWERELGCAILHPEDHGLGDIARLDPPRHFAAYLHALKWNCVTATDGRLFQSPFRAGIQLLDHQLVPLKKALELPRVNLFIADDVGLGKTIEAGLVMSELILRQRVDQALIVCPASVCLQWRDEMEKRFGLRFEIVNRAFIARRREERGFGVNPWSTFPRFIVSYQTLRRPEYNAPLLQHLGDRASKSLLILDEAHTAAPATASKYAVDSQVTRMIRELAPKFEHRLFLSATPHNGHSNSFAALLEILDSQRFTRGVTVQDAAQLDPVMVRRLKSDLIALGVQGYPRRRLVQIDLIREGDIWQQHHRIDGTATDTSVVGAASDAELRLSRLLAQYGEVLKATTKRGRLVLTNLQKRLLSSVEAFARTLSVHAEAIDSGKGIFAALGAAADDDDERGADEADDETLSLFAEADAAGTSDLATPSQDARALLNEMKKLAQAHRREPNPRVLALLDWIRRNQCTAVRIGGIEASGKSAKTDLKWSDRRVIIFTEYADTKRYLRDILAAAIDGTADSDDRIMELHGGMSDEQREEVQQAFNGSPAENPVRILLATDAAREGVNLQGHCADLFHMDVPWNPGRLEQRNGRIDRTLQREPEVRCHYFFYPQRPEDSVLKILVEKVDTIRRELGSLSAVVSDRLTNILEGGIGPETAAQVAAADQLGSAADNVRRELESTRALERVRAEREEVSVILNRSREILEYDPALLKDALNVGFELAGAQPMKPITTTEPLPRQNQAFQLPELPGWESTLDSLRPPRRRDEAHWEWRQHPPTPIAFAAANEMTTSVAHLHLQHPLVERVLGRFRAQGFSAHDLSRVTVLRNPRDSLARVIAFGRLTLFGPSATRLHEEILAVAARWIETPTRGAKTETLNGTRLRPFGEQADRNALSQLETLLTESPDLSGISEVAQSKLRESAPGDFADLWDHIKKEGESREHDAAEKLRLRGSAEAERLRGILRGHQTAIKNVLSAKQLPLFPQHEKQIEKEVRQFENDRKHMEERLISLERELEVEPPRIQVVYRVVLRRLEPVGLIYLWPATR